VEQVASNPSNQTLFNFPQPRTQMSTMTHPGGNLMGRRFQSTGFGADRDPKALPMWKQKMLNSMRSRAKQHREQLLQRLHQQKKSNKHLSPNSKKKSANQTLDSFKQFVVENEMKFQFNSSTPSPSQSHKTPNSTLHGNASGNANGNGNGVYHQEEDYDHETAKLSPEQYKEIFAELAGYLEDTELSGLRAEIASLEELEKDEEEAALEEIVAADALHDPHVVYCPLCCKGELQIEYLNHHQPVYSCFCGIKFRPRDCNVSNKMEKEDDNEEDDDIDLGQSKNRSVTRESDLDHAHRMLRTLKQNIGSLMGYHSNELRCHQQLNFAVVNETGYLQAWCTRCGCNEIVI